MATSATMVSCSPSGDFSLLLSKQGPPAATVEAQVLQAGMSVSRSTRYHIMEKNRVAGTFLRVQSGI